MHHQATIMGRVFSMMRSSLAELIGCRQATFLLNAPHESDHFVGRSEGRMSFL